MSKGPKSFQPLNIVVMTVSDKRSAADDSSGDYLCHAIQHVGHTIIERCISPDNRYQIRAKVSQWIADDEIQVIVLNGGTGFHPKNSTAQALVPLFDRQVEGFGELFRQLSFQSIGSAALQSQALAGLANQTLIFALPGATNACELAWQHLIEPQLNAQTLPCNFVSQLKKRDYV